MRRPCLAGNRRLPALAVLSLLGFASALAACAVGESRSGLATALRSAIDDIAATRGFPGMTVAVAWTDSAPVSVATGFADLEAGEPMTPSSRMLAASIGKTFVAASVLALADDGRLTIDDPLSGWLGERQWFDRLPNARSMTIRHLLSHRSGLPDHVHMKAFSEAWSGGSAAMDPESLIALVLDRSPAFAAGEDFAYSDTGYLLLGLVIEAVTGEPWSAFVQSRFLDPLGLVDTGPSNTMSIDGLATGYVSPANGLDLPMRTTGPDGRMLWDPAIESTGGGLYSTSRDLAVWGRALFGGVVLSPDRLETMTAGRPAAAFGPGTDYGLGVAILKDGVRGQSFGHGGWIPGYVSSLRYYPEYGAAIAFQVNTDVGVVDSDEPVMYRIEQRLADLVFRGHIDRSDD